MKKNSLIGTLFFALLAAVSVVRADNILISGSEMNSAIQGYLTTLGHSSTIVATSTFGTTSFSGYDAIWLGWQSNFSGLSSRQADLINFMNAGGNVLAEITHANGNPVTDYPYGSEISAPPSVNPDTISIANGAHPVVAGLTSADLSNWGNSAHGYYTSIGSFSGIADTGTPGQWTLLAKEVGSGNFTVSALDISFHIKNGNGATGAASPKGILANNALTLANNVTSLLNVSPTALDFGKQLVGTTSASQGVSASNAGTGHLVGTFNAIGGANAGQFQSGAGTAKPFEAATVTFDNPSAGSLNSLSFTESGMNVISLQNHLHGNSGTSGSGLQNHSDCCSTPYRFALVSGNPFDLRGFDFINFTGTNTFTDSGSASFTVPTGNGVQGPPASGFVDVTSFQWDTNGSVPTIDNLEYGGSESYTFAPTTVGVKNATVEVTSNGGDQTVSLTGEGVAPISTPFDQTNNSASFVLVGTTGTASVAMTNIGNGNESGVAGSGVLSVPGGGSNLNGLISAGAGEFALQGSNVISLADGAIGTFTYDYTPAARGLDSESLGALLGNGNPDGTNTAHAHGFTLQGQGVAPLQSTSDTDAGNVRVGTSGTASANVTNLGDGNLSGLGAVSNLNGSAASLAGEFSGAGGAFSVADGASTSFSYTYTPSARGGDAANVLVSYTNGSVDGTNSAASALLTLSGTGVGPIFNSSIAPGSTIDFGDVPVGSLTTIALDIRNISPDGVLPGNLTALTIDSFFTITGPDAAEFNLLGISVDEVLQANGSDVLNLLVEFTPNVPWAEKNATLTLLSDQDAPFGATSSGDSFSWQLTGVATPEPASLVLWSMLGLFGWGWRSWRKRTSNCTRV